MDYGVNDTYNMNKNSSYESMGSEDLYNSGNPERCSGGCAVCTGRCRL